MSKVAIVFWSGTGNTEAMANAILEGAKSAGAETSLFQASEFSSDLVKDFDALAFGCPSMGSEQLEDSEFEPMFDAVKPSLSGKKIALFGSYDWGDGEWIRTWAEDCENAGCILLAEPLIANNTPGDDDLANCKALGATIAK